MERGWPWTTELGDAGLLYGSIKGQSLVCLTGLTRVGQPGSGSMGMTSPVWWEPVGDAALHSLHGIVQPLKMLV